MVQKQVAGSGRARGPSSIWSWWRRWFPAMVWVFALSTDPANAYVNPPFVTNPPAVEGQPFTIDVRWGACHGFQSVDPLDRELVREGSLITVTVRGYIATGAACIFPAGGSRLQVGPLPAGEYQIDLRIRLVDAPTVVLPGSASTVIVQPGQGPGSIVVPSLSMSGLLTLFMLFGLSGFALLRRR